MRAGCPTRTAEPVGLATILLWDDLLVSADIDIPAVVLDAAKGEHVEGRVLESPQPYTPDLIEAPLQLQPLRLDTNALSARFSSPLPRRRHLPQQQMSSGPVTRRPQFKMTATCCLPSPSTSSSSPPTTALSVMPVSPTKLPAASRSTQASCLSLPPLLPATSPGTATPLLSPAWRTLRPVPAPLRASGSATMVCTFSRR